MCERVRRVMADIKLLKPLAKEANADAVEMLEELLKQAKAGDITGFAAAALLADRSAFTTWSSTEHWPSLIGAVAILHGRMITDDD